MFSMVIIMVSMLALLTSITTSISTNMASEIRNTAVRVTNETAEALLALPITDPELVSGSTRTNDATTFGAGLNNKGFPNPTQKIRDYEVTYTIGWTVASESANLKQVEIVVGYTYRNVNYRNGSLIYKHRAI
jgi:hypothetical protein